MKKYLIAYTFEGGCQGWLVVNAENWDEAMGHWYGLEIDGKANYCVEV